MRIECDFRQAHNYVLSLNFSDQDDDFDADGVDIDVAGRNYNIFGTTITHLRVLDLFIYLLFLFLHCKLENVLGPKLQLQEISARHLESPFFLKIGSFSFECIIILLIYFINCQKALFTRK